MVGLRGSAAPVWLVAESLPQLLPLPPDEQLGAADVQLLANSLWAHSVMNHSDSLASEGDAVLCRHFALARIDAGNSRGDLSGRVMTVLSGRVMTGAG